MSKNKRRHFFKTTLITGSAASLLPKKWLKPMISTVIIPAHAQTSPEQVETTSSTTTLSPSVETTAALPTTLPTTLAEVCNPDASSPTEFMFTGSSQEFIVPTGITSLDITAAGGEGGGSGGLILTRFERTTSGADGSTGESVTQNIAVTACEVLRVVVAGGGAGGSYGGEDISGTPMGGPGGYSGGQAGENGTVYGGDGTPTIDDIISTSSSGGGSGGNSIVYRGAVKLIEARGGTGGGGAGYYFDTVYGMSGTDGGAGGNAGNPNDAVKGGDGGSVGYNGSGSGGAAGTGAANGENGANGSITITF